MISPSLISSIKRHEGYRSHAYRDSVGVLTIGYGLNLDDGISEQLAEKILILILKERQETLSSLFPFWKELTPARQDVFLNMAFNMGIPRFLGFRRMLSAAASNDIAGVCREMRNSKWFLQVKGRAEELIEDFRKG